jgi:uncharacterized protein (TIGR02246 family)
VKPDRLAMRTFAFLLSLLIVVLPYQSRAGDDEDEILHLEKVLAAAWLKHDTATIAPIIADDLQYWSFKGVRRGKPDLLRAVEKSEEDDTKIEDPSVRVFGDAAVYTARITDTGRHANGESFSATTLVTAVFVRRDGKWRMVADHESLIQK